VIDLAAHISTLRAAEEAAGTARKPDSALLFWGTAADKNYLPLLKSCVGSYTTFIRLEALTTVTQVHMYAEAKGITRVVSTSVPLLKKLLGWDKRRAPSLSDYAGSYFKSGELEIIFVQPLKQLATVPYGKFMAQRLIGKLIKEKDWFDPPAFTWEILSEKFEALHYKSFSQDNCFLIAVDIETFRENATIRCISYTGFWYDTAEPSGIHSESVVLLLDSLYNL